MGFEPVGSCPDLAGALLGVAECIRDGVGLWSSNCVMFYLDDRVVCHWRLFECDPDFVCVVVGVTGDVVGLYYPGRTQSFCVSDPAFPGSVVAAVRSEYWRQVRWRALRHPWRTLDNVALGLLVRLLNRLRGR